MVDQTPRNTYVLGFTGLNEYDNLTAAYCACDILRTNNIPFQFGYLQKIFYDTCRENGMSDDQVHNPDLRNEFFIGTTTNSLFKEVVLSMLFQSRGDDICIRSFMDDAKPFVVHIVPDVRSKRDVDAITKIGSVFLVAKNPNDPWALDTSVPFRELSERQLVHEDRFRGIIDSSVKDSMLKIVQSSIEPLFETMRTITNTSE